MSEADWNCRASLLARLRRPLAGLLALLVAGCSGLGLPGGNQSNPVCAASTGRSDASGVTIVRTYLCNTDDSTVVLVVARNEGTSAIKLGGENAESFSLLAGDGSVLDAGDLRVMPQYLGPGETGYLGGWASRIGTLDIPRIDRVDTVVAASPVDVVPAQTLKAENVAVVTQGRFVVATGSVSNTGSTTVYGGVVAVILLDGSDVPLGWLLDEQTASGLEPGKTVAFSANFPPQPASIASLAKSTKVFAFDLELF